MFKGPTANITMFVNSHYNNVVYTIRYSKKNGQIHKRRSCEIFFRCAYVFGRNGFMGGGLTHTLHLSYNYNILKI